MFTVGEGEGKRKKVSQFGNFGGKRGRRGIDASYTKDKRMFTNYGYSVYLHSTTPQENPSSPNLLSEWVKPVGQWSDRFSESNRKCPLSNITRLSRAADKGRQINFFGNCP